MFFLVFGVMGFGYFSFGLIGGRRLQSLGVMRRLTSYLPMSDEVGLPLFILWLFNNQTSFVFSIISLKNKNQKFTQLVFKIY